MRFRSAFMSAATAALVAAGCASGGGGPVEAGDDGFRPRDNDHTQTAQLFLLQAEQAEDARSFPLPVRARRGDALH